MGIVGWRRRDELERLRKAALAAASAAARAAAAADRAEAAVDRLIKAHESSTDNERNLGRRFVALSLACAALIVLAIVAVLHGTEAFRDPAALSTNFGNVGI